MMPSKKTKKTKKPTIIYKEIEFDFNKLFPSEGKLGREILSLMAALNDAAFLREFSRTQKKINGKASPTTVFSCGKMFFLIRMMCAVLFEAINIVERISKPKYRNHLDLINDEGQQALKRLLAFKENETGKKFDKARNKITFHYDCSSLTEGLHSLIKNFEGEKKSSIIEISERKGVAGEHNETSFYFSFADIVRQESVFGLLKPNTMEDIVKIQLEIERDLGIFFSSLFNVYQKEGNFCAFDGGNYFLEPF